MKKNTIKILFFTFLILVIAGATYHFTARQSSPLDQIVQSNGEVTDAVVRILGWTGIRVANDKLPVDPNWPTWKVMIPSRKLEDVVKVTNGDTDPSLSWSQKAKTSSQSHPPERWEMKGEFTPDQVNNIVDLYFIDLKLGELTSPQKKSYQGILFLGASLPRVRSRLAHLNKLIDDKGITGPIYLLTGERPLSEEAHETEKTLVSVDEFNVLQIKPGWVAPPVLPSDEGGMVKLVFDQSKHPSLSENDIIMIYAQKRPHERRATREGTTLEWLKTDPKPGTYLAISNQPYNLNQQLVIKRVLLQEGRHDIHVDVAGMPVSETEVNDYRNPQKVSVLLDNLNRIFMEIKTIRAIEK